MADLYARSILSAQRESMHRATTARLRAEEARWAARSARVDAAWRARADAIFASGDPEAIAAYHADIARALGR